MHLIIGVTAGVEPATSGLETGAHATELRNTPVRYCGRAFGSAGAAALFDFFGDAFDRRVGERHDRCFEPSHEFSPLGRRLLG